MGKPVVAMVELDLLDWLQVAAAAAFVYFLGAYMAIRHLRKALDRIAKEGRR